MISVSVDIPVYHNQSASQVVVLQLAMKSSRKLDTLISFYYFSLNCILCYVVCMKNVHYHTELHVLDWFPMPTLYAYLWTRQSVEHDKSYILRKPRLWCRSCRNSKCQFATGESEPWELWQHVSAYPSVFKWHSMALGDFWQAGAPLLPTQLKPHNSMLHAEIGIATSCCWWYLILLRSPPVIHSIWLHTGLCDSITPTPYHTSPKVERLSMSWNILPSI